MKRLRICLQPVLATGSFNAGMYTRNRVIGEAGTKNDDFTYIVIRTK